MFIEEKRLMFEPLPNETEAIAREIVDSAYKVHTELGPGLLEKVYESCFCHELIKRNIKTQRQIIVPIQYDNLFFEEGFRLDVLVGDCVICEIKSVENTLPVHKAQIMTYLKLTGKRLGFLINFNTSTIKEGLCRIIL